MAAEQREAFYKRSGKSLSSIKQTNKDSVYDRQARSRENIITRKRLKFNPLSSLEDVLHNISEQEENEQIIQTVKNLKKKGSKLESLTELHTLFASHQSNSEVFLKNDGLPALHSCFKSQNVEVLHTATWCVINLTASSSSQIVSSHSKAILSLAPTLMQFLKGSDVTMQELCAWGLANMAGDNVFSADVLHTQGCTDTLLSLLDTLDRFSNEEWTRSILFALVNLARNSPKCVQHMSSRDVDAMLQILWKGVDVVSSLNFELGWFVNSLFSRSDSQRIFSHKLVLVAKKVRDRLNGFTRMDDVAHKHKISFPFLRCLVGLIGNDILLARVVLDDIQTFETIANLLTHGPDLLKREALALINNCFVDLCCRVLLTFHLPVFSQILSLCQHTNTDIAEEALQLVQTMAHTSSMVDTHLLNHGILTLILSIMDRLVRQHRDSDNDRTTLTLSTMPGQSESVLSLVLAILTDLISSLPDLVKASLQSECSPEQRSSLHLLLEALASAECEDKDMVHTATQLLRLLELPP